VNPSRPIAGRASHLDTTGVMVIVTCCALWGLQQVAVKSIVNDVAPLVQAAARSFGAALLVWAWSRLRGIPLFGHDGTLAAGIVAGLLFAAEFLCIYLGLPRTSASRLVVFLYLAPFVVALGLPRFVPSERLNRLQTVGLVGAFIALAFAFEEGFHRPATGQLFGDALAVAAAVFWGLTTLVVRATRLAIASPEKTLFYQLAVSALFLGIASYVSGDTWPIDVRPLALASLAFQTVVVAFASYLAWFWLLRRYSATRISSFTFLTPIFGLAFGALLLGEPLGGRIVTALVCVAFGIYLVNRKSATPG